MKEVKSKIELFCSVARCHHAKDGTRSTKCRVLGGRGLIDILKPLNLPLRESDLTMHRLSSA